MLISDAICSRNFRVCRLARGIGFSDPEATNASSVFVFRIVDRVEV